jgi:hypothetical protein
LLLEIDAYGSYILNKKEVGTAKGIATGTTTYILAAPHSYLPYILPLNWTQHHPSSLVESQHKDLKTGIKCAVED